MPRKKRERKRTKFGGLNQKLSIDPRTEQYLKENQLVPQWINDVDNRIFDAQEADYNFVIPPHIAELGDKAEAQPKDRAIKKWVGRNSDNSPIYAYLMAIPRKYYLEDREENESVNQRVDEAIAGGSPEGVQHHNVDPSKGSTTPGNIQYKP